MLPGDLGATIHHVAQLRDCYPDPWEVFTKLYADDLVAGAKTAGKAFGLYWDCYVLEFAHTLPLMKRTVLKIAAKVLDPFGYLSETM